MHAAGEFGREHLVHQALALDARQAGEGGRDDLDKEVRLALGARAGWRKAVMLRLGRVKGCTHLTELLLGPLTATAMQTLAGARTRRQEATDDGRPPPILDTCHALARTSELVRQHWPEWHEEEQPGLRSRV